MGLGAWRWPFQLPLEEAHAPQTRGVHGLRRHVEAPTGADAVIETLPHAPERRCPPNQPLHRINHFQRVQPGVNFRNRADGRAVWVAPAVAR